jgi:hypothetical protein
MRQLGEVLVKRGGRRCPAQLRRLVLVPLQYHMYQQWCL